jgi:hypothetical protein
MKEFNTIEISNPRFENDFLRYITVKSEHLKGRGDICVFVPPGIEDLSSCPLVILLHGVYGSSWSWALSGGVKGKREEITREEVHEVLKNKLGLRTIHSEYGMTELLSQAYSKGNGLQ